MSNVSDVLNDRWALPWLDDTDDVEPNHPGSDALLSHVPERKVAQFAQLAPSDSFEGCAMGHRSPGLHLADDQGVSVAGDDIEFADIAPPIPMQDHHPLVTEIVRGESFTESTQGILGRQWRRYRLLVHPMTVPRP
jgi:hypothetical protein